MPERLAIDGGARAVPPGLEKKWPDIRKEDETAVMRVLERGVLGGAYAPEAVGLQTEFAGETINEWPEADSLDSAFKAYSQPLSHNELFRLFFTVHHHLNNEFSDIFRARLQFHPDL
jgi:hypothetical protein